MKRVLKDPLIHFLAMGIALFVVYGVVAGEGSDEVGDRIDVGRDDLLMFMQYRAKAFDQERFSKLFDELDATARQKLVDDYVREEALFREAKAMNLDVNDYVARRRLIQQLEFITRGFITDVTDLTEDDLRVWREENEARYFVPEKITFTHVYFSNDKHGPGRARELASEMLADLIARQVPFHEAVSLGDRFLYHRNYVARTRDEIASHFGDAMQEQVFDLDAQKEADDGVDEAPNWQGPFASEYGMHLVLVTRKLPGYLPDLAEIRGRVADDALQARLTSELNQVLDTIVAGYKVELGEGVL